MKCSFENSLSSLVSRFEHCSLEPLEPSARQRNAALVQHIVEGALHQDEPLQNNIELLREKIFALSQEKHALKSARNEIRDNPFHTLPEERLSSIRARFDVPLEQQGSLLETEHFLSNMLKVVKETLHSMHTIMRARAPSFMSLPDEIRRAILSTLDPPSLARMALVSKDLAHDIFKVLQKTGIPHIQNMLARLLKELSECAVEEVTLQEASQNEPAYIVTGIITSPESQETDRERLSSLVHLHNAIFKKRIHLALHNYAEGCLEKTILPVENSMYIRADIHSDLLSLIFQITLWQEKGLLDALGRCADTFHIFLLGDYTDRGINDIQVLTILLALRMINPNNVHLIRGNHESTEVQQTFGLESNWVQANYAALERCYASFPKAIYVRGPAWQKHPERPPELQYLHLSHGLFDPSLDIRTFLIGQKTLMAIKGPIYRLFEEREDIPFIQSEKQIDAQTNIEAIVPLCTLPYSNSLTWGDIGPVTCRSIRGAGITMDIEHIRAYARANSTAISKIKAFIRGHQHHYEEHGVWQKRGGKKVLASTLPVATLGNLYAMQFEEPCQGLYITITEGRIRSWQKQAVRTELIPGTFLTTFRIDDNKVGMYETLT